MLVFHGTDDETVPLTTSQEFFEARPDLVRLVIVPGAGHVRSWNISPEAYESTAHRVPGGIHFSFLIG